MSDKNNNYADLIKEECKKMGGIITMVSCNERDNLSETNTVINANKENGVRSANSEAR